MNVGDRVFIFGKHHIVRERKKRLDMATGKMVDSVQIVPVDSDGKPKRKPSPFDWISIHKIETRGRVTPREAA